MPSGRRCHVDPGIARAPSPGPAPVGARGRIRDDRTPDSRRRCAALAGTAMVTALWSASCPAFAAGEAAAPPAAAGVPAAAASPAPVQAMQDLREAQFQLSMGNLVDAREHFLRVLNVDPKNRAALFGLGTVLVSAGRYADAQQVLEHAIRLFPDDYTLKNNLAWMHATARDLRFRDGEKAAALAREALIQAPTDFHVWSTLAEAYYACGRYQSALRAAEESFRMAETMLSGDALQEFQSQLDRCRRSAAAMSLME